MIHAQAKAIVQAIIDPLPLAEFMAAVEASRALDVPSAPDHPRAMLFGEDPAQTVLGAYATHSAVLDSHGTAPTGPRPDAARCEDPAAFRSLIARFHDTGYTVRVPDVVPLSPPLQAFARALEALIHQPVTASLFWSIDRARAAVHYDENDIIAVQLSGRKRWWISTEPPELTVGWKQPGLGETRLGAHRVVDVGPGDLLYIPRGTPHTVESLSDSLHLSILFTPLTLREAVIAALDHLSNTTLPLRQTLLAMDGEALRDGGAAGPQARIADAVALLLDRCRSDGFVGAALQKRAARMVGALPVLDKVATAPVTPATIVVHAPNAISAMFATTGWIDWAQPGGHIHIHRGVEQGLRFIAETPSFRIADIPGEGVSDAVRVALAERFLLSGFLRIEG
ncbi:cupin domain-containing protein [Sphingomonas colocasiae]|uniref:Cupin domain-containing protein n=1 Tax=Sphingomonas colocasiae TaxID=1848973 RepID=A0ABS7PLH6_9SPHN|nr:cupin domain-containing protein [Sphingomonas colocasiae]MBY8822155.1 cupin domain-containing protein [Sphingomonas colocasiae]